MGAPNPEGAGNVKRNDEASATVEGSVDREGVDRWASRSGWPSSDPIIVGRPSPFVEPKAIDGRFRSMPYRPDTVLDGWSTEALTVRGASVRGYWHRHAGTPRQDDFALLWKPDLQRLVVAVADGVSGASQSHMGATIAVRYATQWLANSGATSLDAIDWKALIESTAWALIEQAGLLLDRSSVPAEDAEHLFATTLVCAVIDAGSPSEFASSVVAVGDSAAWILNNDGYRRVDGGKSEGEGGLSSSAVTGLPRIPKDIEVAEVTIRTGDILLLGTDGFGDPLGSGKGEVCCLFAPILRSHVPSITEFGHMLDFTRETFDDDRTLVAVWPRQPDSSGHS